MEEQYMEKKPAWSVWEAVCVFILTYGLGMLLPLDQMAWFQYLSTLISSESFFGTIFLNALFRVIFLLLFISICLKFRNSLDFRELGLQSDSRGRWLWLGLQQGVVLFFAVTLLSFLLVTIYPFEIKPQAATEIFGQAQGWREILLVFSVVSIFAPFSEELYFRGFLYPALRSKWGRLPAIIITNSIFGILHFDALRFIPIALGGVWLTLLYERTESIYTPMVAHAVWNALMIGLVFLANSLVV